MDEGMQEVDCPSCGGQGWYTGSRPGCCGNVRHGECQGHCAIPEPTQEECEQCWGHGTIAVRAATPPATEAK